MHWLIEYFKSFGVDANTTATIFITIFTFSIGLFATWLASYLKKAKEKKSYKKSLILILKDFSKSCDKQDKIVRKSLEKVGFKKGNDFILSYIPISTLNYLNGLDFNIFLQNFEPFLFKKNFSKAVSKLFELFAHLKIQNDSIHEFLNKFSDEYKKHEKDYYTNISELRKIHDNLGVQYDGKQLDRDKGGDLVQGYFHIFGEWMRNGQKRDYVTTHSLIVSKVLELTRKHQKIPLILPMNEHALRCDIAYENINKIEGILFDKFVQFAHFHRRASKVMKVIIAILE